ncbi:MAG: sugar O-acetyltransferase [Methanobacteriaceae archaeon]|jgi:acetyltransferase-like isoleucine patch superfamily enzyme|uniref:sugar O-acetyltransferase n=1 Tax=Methanobrevibacter TaxID=2172 RepID=UPI002A16AF78|nr:sugar O-acetyltransferase [Methanobacteriaceae archaeon]MDD3409049.1 sugar O-acetyltransferase [Methanobacteriaceae archaeon]MDD4594557.1 sugar O-acetyltransferase [Methanobacteriaceae archaeon]
MKPENNIFQRIQEGQEIKQTDPEIQNLYKTFDETLKTVQKINTTILSKDEIRKILSKQFGYKIHESVYIIPPIYLDYGHNIKLGKNIFINHSCSLLDQGGITIDDNVIIAPKVNLITTNHKIKPEERTTLISKPIHIKENVWIGTNATILPGVTIGKNSIIAAGAVVSKDVKDNVIVAGVPGKIIKKI